MELRLKNNLRWGLLVLVGVTLFVSPATVAQTQDQTEEQETPYTEEEYAAYLAATQEQDLVKRRKMMIQFMKDNPKSALNPYVVTAYQQLLRDHYEKKEYGPLAEASEEYLSFDTTDLLSIAMAAEGYRNQGNHAKYVIYGQKVFENMASGVDAYNLTKAYQALGDDERYIEWAEKTLELLPPATPGYDAITLDLLSRMTHIHAEKKDMGEATKLAQKLIPVLEKAKKPENASAAEWNRYISNEASNAWSLVGESHYNSEKWQDAMKAYERTLKYIPKNDLAYYRIGLCYWKLQDVDNAIDNFALAYVLEGKMQKSAYGYLEQLYKALHNNTTVGMNKVLDRARQSIKN